MNPAIPRYGFRRRSFLNTPEQVECKECNQIFNVVTNTHLKRHGLTTDAYLKKHGLRGFELQCQSTRIKRSINGTTGVELGLMTGLCPSTKGHFIRIQNRYLKPKVKYSFTHRARKLNKELRIKAVKILHKAGFSTSDLYETFSMPLNQILRYTK